VKDLQLWGSLQWFVNITVGYFDHKHFGALELIF